MLPEIQVPITHSVHIDLLVHQQFIYITGWNHRALYENRSGGTCTRASRRLTCWSLCPTGHWRSVATGLLDLKSSHTAYPPWLLQHGQL
jgi:hypothetical protein